METENRKKAGRKKRPKMPVSQRAKQFMPFAAVTGLEKALREKEEEIIRRRER